MLLIARISHFLIKKFQSRNVHTSYNIGYFDQDMDDNLFQRILRDKNHILHVLLPDRRRSLEYELRPRSHDRELVP